jgi:hypothetical protein
MVDVLVATTVVHDGPGVFEWFSVVMLGYSSECVTAATIELGPGLL